MFFNLRYNSQKTRNLRKNILSHKFILLVIERIFSCLKLLMPRPSYILRVLHWRCRFSTFRTRSTDLCSLFFAEIRGFLALRIFFSFFRPFCFFSLVVCRRLALSHTIPFYESVNNLWTTFPASISRRDAREEKFGPSCCRSRTGSSIYSDEMCAASTRLPTLLPQEIGNFWTARLGRSMWTTWSIVIINLHGQLWLSFRVLWRTNQNERD